MNTTISNPKRLTYLLYVLLVGAVAVVTLSMVSCSKMDVQLSNPNKAVVKGFLIAGKPVSVSITKQIAYGSTDTTSHPIENLEVIIYDSKSTPYPLVYTTNGIYKSNVLIPAIGETYTLKFAYNGKELSGSTTVPAKPVGFNGTAYISVEPIDSETGPPSMSRAEYSWNNTTKGYYLMVVESTTPNATQINDPTKYDALPAFKSSPTQGDTQNFMGRMFYYYGMHNVILYAINQEYVDLYEDTGNSSQNITNPPGNITNGFGIFTSINADTLKLKVTP